MVGLLCEDELDVLLREEVVDTEVWVLKVDESTVPDVVPDVEVEDVVELEMLIADDTVVEVDVTSDVISFAPKTPFCTEAPRIDFR